MTDKPVFIPFTLKGIKENSSQHIPFKVDHLDIHREIKDKLDYFYRVNKIPHIIFHGSSGSGKFTVVYDFIQKIYDHDKQKIKTNVMIVNCSHGKGIKFIREELKLFAKTNIQNNANVKFKTILLLNAHHLTIDAQSALRRCIELFSYNTRFFIIVENKNKLLNPILSRFSEIYIPEMMNNGELAGKNVINLHKYVIEKKMGDAIMNMNPIIDKYVSRIKEENSSENIPKWNAEQMMEITENLYNEGVSAIDLVDYLFLKNGEKLSKMIVDFNNVKSEFRCEKLLIYWVLTAIHQNIH
jgi:DNA polymerase III delta prime subunit